jgi:3-methyladenine DNA glycosylase AlkD
MNLTSDGLIKIFRSIAKQEEAEKNARFYRDEEPGNKFLGIRILHIFQNAKDHAQMPLEEIVKLLESPYYELRMAAVSIMDFRSRNKKTDSTTREALYDLYIKRHDRINNWDLVDRSAPYVVGAWLSDKSRKPLYMLAHSANPWERRTAIVSTAYFIKSGDTEDTFSIAEKLVHDDHELIRKASGSWIREAGKKNKAALLAFLDEYACEMASDIFRYSTEKLNTDEKKYYQLLRKNK